MNKLIFSSVMIFVAALSRLIPHPGNFTPVMAIALFAGVTIFSKRESLLVPVLAMLFSDFFLGFHSLMPVTYGCMALITILGWYLPKESSAIKTAGFGIIGAVLFFVVTNFAVWGTTPLYEKSISGLIQCYVMAIPFFYNSLASTLVYGSILFGGTRLFEMLETNYKLQVAYQKNK